MNAQEKILHCIYQAIDETNALYDKLDISKAESTTLFGDDGHLDSLGLANLIVAVEQEVEEAFGHSVVLADERALSQENSPFKTVGALKDYLAKLIDNEGQ